MSTQDGERDIQQDLLGFEQKPLALALERKSSVTSETSTLRSDVQVEQLPHFAQKRLLNHLKI